MLTTSTVTPPYFNVKLAFRLNVKFQTSIHPHTYPLPAKLNPQNQHKMKGFASFTVMLTAMVTSASKVNAVKCNTEFSCDKESLSQENDRMMNIVVCLFHLFVCLLIQHYILRVLLGFFAVPGLHCMYICDESFIHAFIHGSYNEHDAVSRAEQSREREREMKHMTRKKERASAKITGALSQLLPVRGRWWNPL
jgi:hypothetical protein